MASVRSKDSGDEPFKRKRVSNVLAWIFLTIVFLVLPYFIWARWLKVDGAPTLALTTTGGLCVITATILNWEKQRLAAYESKQTFLKKRAEDLARDNKQLANYAEMLSTQVPAKVSAALLGIGALADLRAQHDLENVSEFNQRCVGIICSFIRNEGESSEEFRKSAQVNQREALGVIRNHCLRESVNSWSVCDFDLSDVHFWSKVNLDSCIFKGKLDFSKTIFEKDFSAVKAQFDNIIFDCAEFQRDTDFSCSQFDTVSFQNNIAFTGSVTFNSAVFQSPVRFGEVSKWSNLPFQNRIFQYLVFFGGNVSFDKASFCSDAHFDSCNFSDNVSFTGLVVKSNFSLRKVRFSKGVWFDRVQFAESFTLCDVESQDLYLRDVFFEKSETEWQFEYEFIAVKLRGTLSIDGTVFPENLKVGGECRCQQILPPCGDGAIYDGFSILQVEQ